MRSSNASPRRSERPETGLAPFVIDALVRIVRRLPAVERAALYGSRARGDHRPRSDIDIAVFGKNLTFADVGMLRQMHDESAITFRVDFTAYDQLPPDSPLRHTIAEDALVIFERATAPA